MKKIGILAVILLYILTVSGCAGLTKQEELSDKEVVDAFLTAYQKGDYEGMKPYISDDNQLNVMFETMENSEAGNMAEVYRKAHELTKDMTFTATAVEGKERWGEVTVHIQMKQVAYILDAMYAAIEAQVANGDDSFQDLPTWLLSGLEADSDIDEEITVYVGNRDGEMVMDTNTNSKFFRYITGGFYDYIDTTMTTCSGNDEEYYIVANGDNIFGMLQTFNENDSSLTDDDLALFKNTYSSIDGIVAEAQRMETGISQFRLGVDFESASSKTLADLGLISRRITASGGYLSLKSTIKGFEEDGLKCTTEDFLKK